MDSDASYANGCGHLLVVLRIAQIMKVVSVLNIRIFDDLPDRLKHRRMLHRKA